MQLSFSTRELTLKIVYYGPALSGKTTNLVALHEGTAEGNRGRLMTLETKDDRTLFFDMLPLVFHTEGTGGAPPVHVRVKVFTVPGQVIHASTRRLVLQGADGVAFIADSRMSEAKNNAESFLDLRDNLKELGRPMGDVPVAIQYNKRDLPGVRTTEELERLAVRGREPVFAAVATRGEGVVETFITLLVMTYRRLDAEHGLTEKLHISGGDLVRVAAQSLGHSGRVEELLARRLGAEIQGAGS